MLNFIDLGANRGDNIVKFATNGMQNTLSSLTIHDAPSSFCYHAFEPNPIWKPSLNALRDKFRSFWKDEGALMLYFKAAVPPRWPRKMHFRVDGTRYSIGSTLMKTKHVQNMKESIAVPTIDFVRWVDTHILTNSQHSKNRHRRCRIDLLSDLIL